MSRWFRIYDDLIDDVKAQQLSGDLFKVLVNLWCLASKNGGTLPSMEAITFSLRLQPYRARAYISKLIAAGLIDEKDETLRPHNWGRRQWSDEPGDSAPAHSAVHSERTANAPTTRSAVRSTTDNSGEIGPTDTDTERRKKAKSREADAPRADAKLFDDIEPQNEDPRARLFRIGKTILLSFGFAEGSGAKLLGLWLKRQNDPVGLLAAIQFARDQNVAEPVAYITALLNKRKTANGIGKPSLTDVARDLAARARREERESGAR